MLIIKKAANVCHAGSLIDKSCTYCAVPVKVTVCETAGVATLTLRVADLAPSVALIVGLNVTLAVQFEPAATVAGNIPQVVVRANCPGFVPPSAMLLIVIGALPVLLTVTVCVLLTLPRVTDPNDATVGVTARIGACTVPVRVTVADVAGAATVTLNKAFLAVVVLVGLNITVTVQLPPIPSVPGSVPQVFVIRNCPGFAPPSAIPVIDIGAVPVF